jgi:hypothetical protein
MLYPALTSAGSLRAKKVENPKKGNKPTKQAHHVKWGPDRDIDTVEDMPVIVQWGGQQDHEHTKTGDNKAEWCMKYPEHTGCRCTIFGG